MRFIVFATLAIGSAADCSEQQSGIDYPYGDIKMTTTDSADACCDLCEQTSGCKVWVWSPNDTTGGGAKHCWLKHTVNEPKQRSDRISGKASPAPPAPPPPPKWSDKFRGWTYYTGGKYGGFVVPPSPVDPRTGKKIANGQLTDCSLVTEAPPESKFLGMYRMFYTTFDGTGYRTAMATSEDLLDWDFAPGMIFDRGASMDRFDYGGVTFGCPLYENASISSSRILKKLNGKYWMAYGAYPTRGGYEQGSGGEGIAWSVDGDVWERASETVPFMSVNGSQDWDSAVVYQPNLVLNDGVVYDFYNSRGKAGTEQSGFATVPRADFPGIDHATNQSLWKRSAQNPVIPSGPKGSYDTKMASDPKVWWDDELKCWVMIYFGLGDGSGGHADILAARSFDLVNWEKDPEPLYKAGGHPSGIDGTHAHKISLIYRNGVGYLYYTAVGTKGRGIALLVSKPLGSPTVV